MIGFQVVLLNAVHNVFGFYLDMNGIARIAVSSKYVAISIVIPINTVCLVRKYEKGRNYTVIKYVYCSL